MLISEDQVNAQFDALLEGFGENHVYCSPTWGATCRYVHAHADGDTPGCLVGHVLNRLGMSLDALKIIEGTGINSAVAGGALEALDVTLEPNALRLLAVAQSSQDKRQPWGEAISRARETLLTS